MTDTSYRRAVWLLAIASVAVSLAYVFVVPAGQPYDERAHWSNVQFYEHRDRMPELGERDATYEAQMGPVYYTASAAIARVTGNLFDTETAFDAVRVFGALLVGVLVLLTAALGRALFPRRPGVALVAAAFMGLNPSLVAVQSSVQNDGLAMVLALAAALLAVRVFLHPDPSRWRWLLVGLVAGLATITKVFAAGLVAALGIAVLASPREVRARRALGWLFATVGFLLVSGWWFVRNEVLYGDVSGRKGLEAIGQTYPPGYHNLGDVGAWVKGLLSYLWVPTEYYRNRFSAPFPLRAVAIAITAFAIVAGALGLVRAWSARPRGALSPRWVAAGFLASWSALTFVVYTVIVWRWTNLAPRILFVVLPGAVVLVCGAVDVAIRSARAKITIAAITVVTLVATSAFSLYEVTQIAPNRFWLSF